MLPTVAAGTGVRTPPGVAGTGHRHAEGRALLTAPRQARDAGGSRHSRRPGGAGCNLSSHALPLGPWQGVTQPRPAHRTGNAWPSSHLSATSSRVSGTNTCTAGEASTGRCRRSLRNHVGGGGRQRGRAAWLETQCQQQGRRPRGAGPGLSTAVGAACSPPTHPPTPPLSPLPTANPHPHAPRPWPGSRCWSGGGGASASTSSRAPAGTSAAPGPRRRSRPGTG